VCERIPYLILLVRQLSRGPFGSRQSVRPPTEAIYASRRGVAEHASNDPPNRTETSGPLGKPPGPSRTEPSAEAIRASRRASRRSPPRTEATSASRRASHWVGCRVREPAGDSNTEPNPLDYSL
jgi:hypothetical protein